jgi:FkbM family methyltransferase
MMGLQDNCVKFSDYSVFLNPRDKTATELFLIHVNARDWIWESYQLSLFREAIRRNRDCVVLDMGANYGQYSLSAASLALEGLVKSVVALEPNTATFNCLKQSVEFNGFPDHVRLVNAAVSDKHNTRCNFYADPKYSAMSKRDTSRSEPGARSADALSYQALCVRMDDLLDEIGVSKTDKFVMKIDVEGSEPLAFASLEETLGSCAGYQVFFEFHPQAMLDLGHDPLKFAGYLAGLQPDLMAEIDHHTNTVKHIQGMADFERLVNECLHPTKQWADYTNIFLSKGLVLPGDFSRLA